MRLADNSATYMANPTNDDGPNLGAFMVLVDLHSSMLGNQSDGELRATSTVVRCGRLAESQLRKSPLEIGGGVIFRYQ